MCKVAFVYTSTTPELIQYLEEEARVQLGESIQILTYKDPSILSEIREYGYVTANAASRLITLFLNAVSDGAEAILNVCSSVGETADSALGIACYIGVPIVRIDVEMCRDAIRTGSRIGVLATLSTTLRPTKNTLCRMAGEMGRHDIVLKDGLVEAFDLNQEQLRELLVRKAMELAPETDVILLCQGSMACCEQIIADACGKPVVSSPRYGINALKQALIQKGVLC